MSIIKCPECGRDISNKATICPACGYPIAKEKIEINTEPSPSGMNVCPTCGKFFLGKETCPSCKSKMINCHCTEDEWTTMLLNDTLKSWERQIREKYVLKSNHFNKDLYNAQLEYEQSEDDCYKEMMKNNLKSSKLTIYCPYCNSLNTSKISTTSKVVNVAVFGIFGTKRHKQWHCNECGSDF